MTYDTITGYYIEQTSDISVRGTSACLEEETHSYINELVQQYKDQLMRQTLHDAEYETKRHRAKHYISRSR